MSKVDYEFYSTTYGGTDIPEEVFDRFARRAEVLLGSMLRMDADISDVENLQMVLCEICDSLYREDRRNGISRESLDGYDVTYCDDASAEVVQLVRQHLGNSGVLYRGRRL